MEGRELGGFTVLFQFYRYECGLTDILYKADLGVFILALRSVASYPKEIFLEQTLDSRSQSFTSLMVELSQIINSVNSFSRCLNGIFP